MHLRAAELIQRLNLQPHPEGGYFSETYRSPEVVAVGERIRSASTAIYFLLCEGQISRWHAVSSDEVWHHYEGDALELFVMDPACAGVRRHCVGPLAPERAPQCVVPAGHWQAARSLGAYTLVGCTVAPGFDFADFKMLSADPKLTARLADRSQLASLI